MKATESKNQKAAQKQGPTTIKVTEINIFRTFQGNITELNSNARCEPSLAASSSNQSSEFTGRAYIAGDNQNFNFNLTQEDLQKIEVIVKESFTKAALSLNLKK